MFEEQVKNDIDKFIDFAKLKSWNKKGKSIDLWECK